MVETEYARIPETPEEIEVDRKRTRLYKIMPRFTVCFFALILIIVPQEPNNTFYLELNSFLDKYLLGHLLPEFSDKFYFSMKVAWCISFVYYFIFTFILALVVPTYLGREGVKIILYLEKFDKKTPERNFMLFISFIFLLFICFFGSINSYSFESHSGLTILRAFNAFFYGNFIRASFLFLFSQMAFGVIPIIYLLVRFYYYIFCKGEFRF